VVLIWVSLGKLGSGFLGSVAAADPAALGLAAAPTYMETAAGASGSTVLGVLIILGFGSWLVPTVPMSLLIMTRCMFGWSMDRVAPEGLAKVSHRTNSPYVAVLVVTVVSAVVSWFWAYGSQLTVVVGAFPQLITLAIGCLAAALLPFRYRDQYETAPIRGYFGKVPRLTVVALLGAAAALFIVWNFARDPSSGVNPTASPGMFWTSLAFFPLGVLLYYVSRFVRRRQGIDLELAFREIPPD
jgi:amino acid transporter